MTADELAPIVKDFVVHPRSILFAGAGVGCRVGFPAWPSWIKYLAKICRDYGADLEAQLIESRVAAGDYTGAAVIYKTCLQIPIGERLKKMAEPFRKVLGDLELLESLVSLPVSGIITTNYDHSLHEACAKFRPKPTWPLELRDETLRNGALISEFFIARIHGRAEVPDGMVVDDADYQRLQNESDYLDFLLSALRLRPTLFIGFSFLDPAIKSILAVYKKNFGPRFPELHIALVPNGGGSHLAAELSSLNIRTLEYDGADNHKELWRLIRMVHTTNSVTTVPVPASIVSPKDLPQTHLHRVIAFAYARTKTPDAAVRPALEMVQEGVVLSLLNDEPSDHLEKTTVIEKIRELMRVEESVAHELFNQALQRLIASGDVIDVGRYIRRKNVPSVVLGQTLTQLGTDVANRLKVLFNRVVSNEEQKLIGQLWEQLFVVRAWDLAAQYAGSIVSGGIQIEDAVDTLTRQFFPDSYQLAEDVRESILQVLNNPEKSQADALAEISRTAITVQLLLSSPRYAMSHAYTLPTQIYFDASVLLPAIAPGHPLNTGNLSAIRRLKSAATTAGRRCEMTIGTQFLEEIVVHRANALEMVRELKLEEPRAILEHIILYNAQNTNVFVGAFASLYNGKNPTRQSFPLFLNKIAPYTNEMQLTAFLKEKGIAVKEMDFRDEHNVEFNHIFSNLMMGYEQLQRQTGKDKERVLIQHEAQQLTQLFLEARDRKRSVFVTADRRFLRVVQANEELEKLSNSVLSNLGFVGLIDLLVGLAPDNQIFTRLVWASPRTTAQKQVRDYLVAATLRTYDDAMLMAMPTALQEVLAVANTELASVKGNFGRATDMDDAKRAEEFLDRIEDKYFEKIREVIERREKQS